MTTLDGSSNSLSMSISTKSSGLLNRKALKRPDEFTTSVQSGFDRLSKHATLTFAGIALVLVVGAGIGYWGTHHQSRSSEAMNALFEARFSLETTYASMAKTQSVDATSKAPAVSTPPAKRGAKAEKATPPADRQISVDTVRMQPMDVDAKLGDSVRKLIAVAEKYSGKRAGYEARMLIADTYYSHGEPAKALAHLNLAVAMAPDKFEKALSLNALGYAYESSGKFPEAITAFEKASQEAGPALKGGILLAIARNHELAGQNDKAITVYDQVLSQMPNTESAQMAEQLKARLK